MDKDLELQTYKALMLFMAMAKAQNDEYTRFLGMFKHKDKQVFNELIKASNRFVSVVYDSMDQETQQTVDQIQDLMHDFVYQVIETGEFKNIDNLNIKNLKP